MNTTPILPAYVLPPTFSDDQRFRRRRPVRCQASSPNWIPTDRNTHSLIPFNNSPQPAGKIVRFNKSVSVTYADPTGGSMIVTRRRQDGHLDVRIMYSREFIIAASASPYALLPPANFRQMVLEMMDIIAKFPKSYYNSIRQDMAAGNSQ
uniref:Uncharacterized protein n=1 Tax=Setaria digitata TaxID=48799 RepID=A0A915PW85_9BILA